MNLENGAVSSAMRTLEHHRVFTRLRHEEQLMLKNRGVQDLQPRQGKMKNSPRLSGSVVENGEVVGSRIVAQEFASNDPRSDALHPCISWHRERSTMLCHCRSKNRTCNCNLMYNVVTILGGVLMVLAEEWNLKVGHAIHT